LNVLLMRLFPRRLRCFVARLLEVLPLLRLLAKVEDGVWLPAGDGLLLTVLTGKGQSLGSRWAAFKLGHGPCSTAGRCLLVLLCDFSCHSPLALLSQPTGSAPSLCFLPPHHPRIPPPQTLSTHAFCRLEVHHPSALFLLTTHASLHPNALHPRHPSTQCSPPTCPYAKHSSPTHPTTPSPAQAGIPLLVLGNKNDLPEALSANELISRLGLKALTGREVAAYSMSCRTQANLDVVLRWLQAHAK
jgi:hypothetical protein